MERNAHFYQNDFKTLMKLNEIEYEYQNSIIWEEKLTNNKFASKGIARIKSLKRNAEFISQM